MTAFWDDPHWDAAWSDVEAARRDPELFWALVARTNARLSTREVDVLTALYPPPPAVRGKERQIAEQLNLPVSTLNRIAGDALREIVRQRRRQLLAAEDEDPAYQRGYAAGYATGRQELLDGLAGLFGTEVPA